VQYITADQVSTIINLSKNTEQFYQKSSGSFLLYKLYDTLWTIIVRQPLYNISINKQHNYINLDLTDAVKTEIKITFNKMTLWFIKDGDAQLIINNGSRDQVVIGRLADNWELSNFIEQAKIISPEYIKRVKRKN